ncbi:MAG: rhomboid family intramembrane serine protease [Alphaproteobacteria bacterium]|nr:rhomboid family intramembrane serine protease [Alphaproteobacteria bacterium]
MNQPFTPIPPEHRPPAFNAPNVVLWLIGITVAVFLFQMFAPDRWANTLLFYTVFNPADLKYFAQDPVVISIRWIGYGLIHGGWMHICVNMAFLLAFGTPLARQIPTLSFIALYLLGTAGGALAVMLIYGNTELYLVGASGGVSALVGALSRMVFLRRGQEVVPHPFSNRRAGMIFVGIFFAMNLLYYVLPGPGGATVSGEAHIGGFISGFILSLILPWRARGKGRPAND